MCETTTTLNLPSKWKTFLWSGGFFVGINALLFPFIAPALKRICIPYLPATSTQLTNCMRLLRLHNCKGPLIDLGSGDGRLVFSAAGLGIKPAHGIETNAWLIAYCNLVKFAQNFKTLSRVKTGKRNEIKFVWRNLWTYPLTNYNTVVVFGVKEMMPDLREKLCEELIPGSKILTCRFPLYGENYNYNIDKDTKNAFKQNVPFKLVQEIGEGYDRLWLYEKL